MWLDKFSWRVFIFVSGMASGSASAAALTVLVTDAAGQPLADVAIYAEPASGQNPPKMTRPIEIEQIARKFAPLVSVIQTGTEISFPNNDTVRHHVYSFSPAKTFDIKLYAGIPASPLMFDKPGLVAVGCNIHDQMVAYIHVVATPYHTKTDPGGKAKLIGLMLGKYKLRAWLHTAAAGAAIPEQLVTITASDSAAQFKLNARNGMMVN